jgi:hypothetical protein
MYLYVYTVQVGADSCTGDGGGPLLCPLASEPGRLIQVLIMEYL